MGDPKNNPDQVTKLQQFLKKQGFGFVASNGLFDADTFAAVKAFQSKYADDILKPWKISEPTGIVYLTTLRRINLLECSALTLPFPALIPWSNR